ncbi:MAG: bacteriohemerythrin [Thermodesulfovibrionales bacterium]|nr:bacteriohemerythrin [Thermodesulfovibrionales bacterium]
MKWTEELAIGINIIDEQHKELIDRINSLVESIRQHACKYKISDTIKFLEDYVQIHFNEEEKYMLNYQYPYYGHHKSQHEFFKKELANLKPELLKLEGGSKPGSYELSVATNQLVVDWILDHIANVDKKLGMYLKNKI